jgi:hypothetical protein
MPLSGEVSRRAISGSHRRRLKGPANAPLERTSQFMDAEDERVRQHTEENLARGTDMIVGPTAYTPVRHSPLLT